MLLEVKNLHVKIGEEKILNGLNLKVEAGEVAGIMGPNGSGKSTLAYALMGHPKYQITEGQIFLNGEDITNIPVDKRAKKGLFLSFQHPQEVPGLTISNFLRTAYNSITEKNISVLDFHKILKERMEMLKIDKSFVKRYLNEGFSGGEKKKMEILQLSILQPKIAILDETDSGTDVDALKIISNGINVLHKELGMGILLITHYDRILQYVKPNKVHILVDGQIVKTGGPELAQEVEKHGYSMIKQ